MTGVTSIVTYLQVQQFHGKTTESQEKLYELEKLVVLFFFELE